MKKLFIGIGIFILSTSSASAFFGKGFDLEGNKLSDEVGVSRPAVVTITDCGSGRMRSVNNYKTKCKVKQSRIGIARRKSVILDQFQSKFRGSGELTDTDTVLKTESLLEKVKRILEEKRK